MPQEDPFTVQLSGIPDGSTVVQAWANWSYLIQQGSPYPAQLAQITINGAPRTGDLTGEANRDLCWFCPPPQQNCPPEATLAYTADITTIVQAAGGNGEYVIGGAVDEAGAYGEGITLLVIYSHPAMLEQQINVYSGMITTEAGAVPGQARATLAFAPLPYQGGPMHFFMNALDGQCGGTGGGWADDFYVDCTTFPNCPIAGGLVDGTRPSPNAWRGLLGLSGIHSVYDHGDDDVATFKDALDTSIAVLTNSNGFPGGGDCIGHSFAAVSFYVDPCQGVPNPDPTDCNNNNLPDECDLFHGFSLDCNNNAIPDECETDCNGNGIPDDCDIAGGTAQDCDNSGVPDVCEFQPAFGWAGSVGQSFDDSIGGESGLGTAQPLIDAVHGNGLAADDRQPEERAVVYAGGIGGDVPGHAVDMDPTAGQFILTSLDGFFDDSFVTRLHRAPVLAHDWSTLLGGVQQGFSWGDRSYGVDVDSTGAVIVVGMFGFGSSGGYLLDFDPAPGIGEHVSNGASDVFVVKYDAQGNYAWSRTFGGLQEDFGLAVAVDSDDDVVVSGFFQGTVDFNPIGPSDVRAATGNYDVFVTKIEKNGGYSWTHTIEGAPISTNMGSGVACDGLGNIHVTGRFNWALLSPANFNPGGPNGLRNSLGFDESDVFVLSLASNGAFLEALVIGGEGDDWGLGIAAECGGSIVVAGRFEGRASFDPSNLAAPCNPAEPYCHDSRGLGDGFVVRLDPLSPSTRYIWSRAIGWEQHDSAISVALDGNGNVLVAGFYVGAADCADCLLDASEFGVDICAARGKRDVFVTQFNRNGDFAWTRTMGGPQNDEGHAITVDGGRNIWVAGVFQEMADFDLTNAESCPTDPACLTAIGGSDAFVVRLDAPILQYRDCNLNGIFDLCDCLPGDVNDDGTFDGHDIQPFVACMLGFTPPGIDCACADANGDGTVSTADIPCFVTVLLGGPACPLGSCGAPCRLTPGPSAGDCDGDGVPDANELFDGTSFDCNGNFIPDECDIAQATSADANANGVPDECEPDCNGNGVPDDLDIAGPTSNDANSNGVPDECDLDCNGNDIPDDLDIAGATSHDCDADGVPDECGWDCNGNGIADSCDIASGTSQDCNENLVPDECDLTMPLMPSLDCNMNGIPDECDIASGTSKDENENGFPDECESEGQGASGGGGTSAPSSTTGGTTAGSSGTGGGGLFPTPAAQGRGTPEAWAAFHEWCAEQTWGPASPLTGREQFERYVDKLRELGLPLRRAGG